MFLVLSPRDLWKARSAPVERQTNFRRGEFDPNHHDRTNHAANSNEEEPGFWTVPHMTGHSSRHVHRQTCHRHATDMPQTCLRSSETVLTRIKGVEVVVPSHSLLGWDADQTKKSKMVSSVTSVRESEPVPDEGVRCLMYKSCKQMHV